MKVKRYFLPGLISGLLIGWALGYLRLPYLPEGNTFLPGLIAGITFISIIIYLLPGRRRNSIVRLMITICILVGAVFGGIMLYKTHETLTTQAQQQKEKLNQLTALVDSMKKGSHTVLLSNLLQQVEDELKSNPERRLSDSTIASIAALSFICKPFPYSEIEGLPSKMISPERGQLLVALCLLNIDSTSFNKIKRSTTFAGADLRETKFQGVDLSMADLKAADFKDADLSGANLSEADLRNTSFGGANLNGANLHCTDMKRANLVWTKLNNTDVTLANLNGADLTNTQLRNANLSGTTLQWARATSTLFNGANMTDMNLLGTDFYHANLGNANLSRSDLRKATLNEAHLTGTKLNRAVVDPNWAEQLPAWQITGGKEILDAYKVVNDSTDKWKAPVYRLSRTQAVELIP